jgi:hypothetical protein
MIKRFKKWNQWRKNNLNNKFYQFLVLIGVVYSITFEAFELGDLFATNFAAAFKAYPKEGLPVTKVEEIDGGVIFTVTYPKD